MKILHYLVHRKYYSLLLCGCLLFFQQAMAQDEEEEVYADTTVFRQVPDSVALKLKKDKIFEYANDSAYWKEVQVRRKRSSGSDTGFWGAFYKFFALREVRIIMYILLGILFLWVIYRVIIQNNLYVFSRANKQRKPDEEEEADVESEDIEEKISKAIAAGNYRAAVRFLYIKTLQLLNNKGWIRYHAQATNHEYILQMSNNKLSNEFNFLTGVYDYVWYGEFELSGDQFGRVQHVFNNFFGVMH